MTSATWLVSVGGAQYVAKLVDASGREQFEAGLAAAEYLSARDIDAGAPVRCQHGGLSVRVEGGSLALLRFVDGRPLQRQDPLDQQWWGDRLGAAHVRLAGFRHPGLQPWHWVKPDAPHLGLEPWLRPAVTEAVERLSRLQVTDRLTWGVLHGDPYYGAFLLDPATGRIGVIDWGAACAGPLMYDVASAVMYAGGPDLARELLVAYAATGAVPRAEIESALPVLLHFRWAVQADFFARRARGGQAEPGLYHAREALLRCSS